MEEIRKKLADLHAQLPMSLQELVNSVKLPEDEDCFEFSYFKTFVNLLNLFAEENAKISVLRKKEKTHYKVIMNKDATLSDPENEDNKFGVVIKMFSSGDGNHRFAELSYDQEVFFIDRVDGSLLKMPILV